MTEKITDKRTAIMDAALKLFSEKGFKETSTANISQAAGVATGTLFLYFKNKEELINKLYLESKDEFAVYIRLGLSDQKKLRDELFHIWNRWMEWTIAHPMKATFMLHFSSSPYISKMTREASMTNLGFINAIVKKACADRQLSSASPVLMTGVITGQLVAMGKFLLRNPDKKKQKTWSDEGFEIMWKGILK
ncbi:MAG TPA: TetR/AcrR family transcriptional regulator [Puia sp.]|nr:TetR/AcrR family transcriptional regulator [Puia sp.]